MKEYQVDGYDTVVSFPDDTPEEVVLNTIKRDYPEPDENFVNRIADPATPASAVSFEDFKKYKELKPDLSWGELGGLVVQGAGMVAGELYNGVKSTAALAAIGQVDKMAASTAEGAARGTYDLANLSLRIKDNVTKIIEPYLKETGDADKDQYNRFLAIKEMDNIREAARQGDKTILQNFGIGVTSDDIDTQAAEAASYFLDPTVLGTAGTTRIGSIFNKTISKAASKPAELAGRAAGATARGLETVKDKIEGAASKAGQVVDEATGGMSKYAVPGAVGGAAATVGLAPTAGTMMAAVGTIPALNLAEGLFKGFAHATANPGTRIGAMRHMHMNQPQTLAGKMAGRLQFLDTPIEYAGRAAAGAGAGAVYGAGLGALAGGKEGAAQGLGAGLTLGAGTGAGMRFVEGLSGRAKFNAEQTDYTAWRAKQDKDTQTFLDTKLKSHKDRIQVMDAVQMAQVGAGDQSTVRILSGDDFAKQFPGADGVQVIEGDTPIAYINGRNGDARVLMHEVFHTMARLDGFDGMVAAMSGEIGRMYTPDEVATLIREYEASGKKLKETEGLVTTGDKFAALAEEVGAEYFANYIKGKDSSYLLKGTPFKDALGSIVDRFVAGKLDRVYDSFKSQIFDSQLKQSRSLDKAMNDLVKARRRAYRQVELSADDYIRAYTDKDLGDDQVFNELQALGIAEIDNKGKRQLKTKYKLNKESKDTAKQIVETIEGLDESGGMVKQGDGSYKGRNFSPAQIKSLLDAPFLSDKVKEALSFIHLVRKAGSDAANLTYAAATYKNKRGQTKAKNLPISNRDALIYGLTFSPVGTITANILDLSLLKAKIARQWGSDARLQREFGTMDAMYEAAINYVNALEGDVPTAQVVGGQLKRNLLNKLLGVRNVKGNPEIPDGAKLGEADHPWRSFRLDRLVKARPLENVKATFSEEAYLKGQHNFSPSVADGVKMIEDVSRKLGVDVSIASKAGGDIILSKIIVPKDRRLAGVGSKVVSAITEVADQSGLKVLLTRSKDFGGSLPRLKKFYKKFGFVENKGKNKDYSISESMYRLPK